MTSEEIKQNTTMADVLFMYNISVRNNMASCPFHGKDKHPSMKIFKDGYNCFTCGAHGDIFSFVQQMDGCDFKTAFLKLGGEYDRPQTAEEKKKAQWDKVRREWAQEQKRKDEQAIRRELKDLSEKINFLLDVINQSEPLSGPWCAAQKKREVYLQKYEDLRKKVK